MAKAAWAAVFSIIVSICIVHPMVAFASNNRDTENTSSQAALDFVADSDHTFEIWPEESRISQTWHSFVHGRICPSPISDATEEAKFDPSDGELIDPGNSIQVDYYAVRPDGAKEKIDRVILNNGQATCQGEGVNTYFQAPDVVGTWTVYATAIWISVGSVHEVSSNNATIQVAEPLYQDGKLSPKLLSNNTLIDSLLDWSRDGKSILATYFKTEEDRSQSYRLSLGILDAEMLKTTGNIRITPIELVEDSSFQSIWQARFSPADSSKILAVVNQDEAGPANVFMLDLDAGKVLQLTNNTLTGPNAINSAVWLPNPSFSSDAEPTIVYGEIRGNDDPTLISYDIWQTNESGQKIKKLYQKSIIPDREGIFIHDASIDGSKLLLEETYSPQYPYVQYNMTILDVYDNGAANPKTRVVFNEHSAVIPRFNPSLNADLVIFDNPTGQRTPGGPIELISVDGGVHEVLKTGQEIPGDDPQSFVISPDGEAMLVTILQWSSGPVRLYMVELAHPLPEFGSPSISLLVLLPISILIALITIRRYSSIR